MQVCQVPKGEGFVVCTVNKPAVRYRNPTVRCISQILQWCNEVRRLTGSVLGLPRPRNPTIRRH
jgi:hypothetical protein